MFFYTLYLAGYAGCLMLPKSICYWVGRRIADFYCWHASADREAVRINLSAILQQSKVSDAQVREVFRNFAVYLVDFFGFSRLSAEEIRRWIRLEGCERMEAALAHGRGAIALSAHLGNYELAGAVLSLLGFPVNAVVLAHQNRRVDAFFTRRRCEVGVKGISIQRRGLRHFFAATFSALQRNEVLALVGDRDFFGHGLELPFFGKSLKVPTGPAAFSLKSGAPILPGFLIREEDGRYRFILESPLPIPQGLDHQEAVRRLTQSCLEVIARYIRRYPTQWYMFQRF